MKHSWTHPICDDCWQRLSWGRPYRMVEEHRRDERCSWCGASTRSGIYLRADPNTVPFPAVEE